MLRAQGRTVVAKSTSATRSFVTMADRYAISKDTIADGAVVPENIKLKLARNAALAEEGDFERKPLSPLPSRVSCPPNLTPPRVT